jgi:hypothetical protein
MGAKQRLSFYQSSVDQSFIYYRFSTSSSTDSNKRLNKLLKSGAYLIQSAPQ